MYKIKSVNKEMRMFYIDDLQISGRDFIDAIEKNVTKILNVFIGKAQLQMYERDLAINTTYEIEINPNESGHLMSLKVKQSEATLETQQIQVPKQDSVQNVQLVLVIEKEKLYGLNELSQFLKMDKRKLNLYINRGKVLKPDYYLSNGPIWLESSIEEKKIVETERGKKIDDGL